MGVLLVRHGCAVMMLVRYVRVFMLVRQGCVVDILVTHETWRFCSDLGETICSCAIKTKFHGHYSFMYFAIHSRVTEK